MKKILYLFVFIGFCQWSWAQDDQEDLYASPVFNFEKGTMQKVLVNETNVRERPNLESNVVATLHEGQRIKIESEPDRILQLADRVAPWYKISFDADGKRKTGYVWAANLCIGYRHLDGYDFLWGASGSKQDEIKMEVKVLKNKIHQQSIFYEINVYESLAYVSFKWLNTNKGLKGVENILVAEVGGEACGIPTYVKNMLWFNGQLKPLPTLMLVSDAGIFYHTEELIFPNDKGGKNNQIIMKTEEAEVINSDEEIDDAKWKYNKKNSEIVYHLDEYKMEIVEEK